MRSGTKATVRLLFWGLFFSLFVSLAVGYTFIKIRPSGLPILGVTPLKQIAIFESHKHALGHWLNSGIKDAVLINLDAHDDIQIISTGIINKVHDIVSNNQGTMNGRDYNDLLSTNIADSDFIFAAARLGIFKEVYWIVPSSFFLDQDAKSKMQGLLRHCNFAENDIMSFRREGDCFKGETNSIPLCICGIDCLPGIREPVVLSIDVDFAPVMAIEFKEQLLDSIKRTFHALAAKRYRVMDTIVAYSVNGGHLGTHHRWVGELTIDILQNPGILKNNAVPEKYKFLQQAELLHMMSRYSELLDLLMPMLDKREVHPSIYTYMARACFGVGAPDHAYRFADYACMVDNNYCYVLPELGSAQLRRNGLDAAEKFFTRGYELNPDMAHGQFRLAQAMKTNGRYDDAIKYLNAFRDYYGNFPADFYLGELHLLKNDEAAALEYFANASHELVSNPTVWTGFGDITIINTALEYYEKKGYDKEARELRMCINTKNTPPRPAMLNIP